MDDIDFSIRRALPADQYRLSLIGQATFLESFADILPGSDIMLHCRTQHSLADYETRLASTGHALWLAEVKKGAPIGYAALSPPDLSTVDVTPGDIELKRIYVLSNFHGTGVAAALMERAQGEARDMGMQRLLVGVYARNGRAIRFYQKNGMQVIGTRKFRVGANDYDDVILAGTL